MDDKDNRLADLLRRFLNNSCTREELDELLDTIDRYPDSKILHHLLRQQWHAVHDPEGIPEAPAKLERLLGASRTVTKEKATETRSLRWLTQKPRRRFAVAAAITLTLLSAIYLFFKPQASAPEKVLGTNHSQTDIAPGRERATLTLADGTAISLDQNGAGTLARQGNMQVVKLDSGQVAYRPSGEDPASGEIGYNILTTPRGGQYKVILPDGTSVWLNAASSIRYPAVFAGKERKVELRGEAYFEVSSKPFSSTGKDGAKGKKPFIIRINGMEIEVLGTHFNVMAYEDENTIHTTLLEGSVSVRPLAVTRSGVPGNLENWRPSGKASVLNPGQQARLANPLIKGADATGEIRVVSNINTRQITAWKDGYFQFEHTDLPTVMRHLARWYDVEVIYNDVDTIPDQYFGGRIPRDLPLSKVLSILQQNEVKFRVQGRQLIILK